MPPSPGRGQPDGNASEHTAGPLHCPTFDKSNWAVHTLRNGGSLMRVATGITRIFNGQLIDGTGTAARS